MLIACVWHNWKKTLNDLLSSQTATNPTNKVSDGSSESPRDVAAMPASKSDHDDQLGITTSAASTEVMRRLLS